MGHRAPFRKPGPAGFARSFPASPIGTSYSAYPGECLALGFRIMSDQPSRAEISPTRPLGRTGFEVSALGVGTNKWAKGSNDDSVFDTYRAFLDAGIRFFDSAEIYGFGKSERLLGDCLRRDGRPAAIATKFMPFLARSAPRHLRKALDGSLARLGVKTIDLYYIHFPFPLADLDALADELVRSVSDGKIRHVGVSNFSADQMRRTAERLARAGLSLAANQVNYSLLNRKPERNGVLDACRELGASLVAYFPLSSGRLAGSPAAAKDERAAKLLPLLGRIAEAHQSTPGQIALAWLLARDPCVIPIPGSTKPGHAAQNAEALRCRLTEEEFAAIDRATAA